jgi:GNAT superfamily N-acetyltransferase
MIVPLIPREKPPDYPNQFERTVRLRDGRKVFIRPVVPSDADHLGREVEEADEETLYLRFFTPVVHLTREQIRHLTVVDYHKRMALAAFARDGEGVAIARYEGATGSAEAEVAVTVKPGWRKLGLAKTLFAMLEEAALANGITTFTADYLPENDGAAALMAATWFSGPEIVDGVATVRKRLGVAEGSAPVAT